MKSIAPRAQEWSAARQSKGRATILVIEDEGFVRDVACQTLRNAGYRVLQAECAGTGRKVFLRYRKRIQLVLCDAVLPDASGLALSQALCRLGPGLKVILASGYPRCVLGDDFNQETKVEFLTKPYGAASLISKVKMVLQKERSSESTTHIRGR